MKSTIVAVLALSGLLVTGPAAAEKGKGSSKPSRPAPAAAPAHAKAPAPAHDKKELVADKKALSKAEADPNTSTKERAAMRKKVAEDKKEIRKETAVAANDKKEAAKDKPARAHEKKKP